MCSVIGMVAFDKSFNDIASHINWGLVETEHRGKEMCGITTNKDSYMDLGTPEQVFNENLLASLGGNIGIGHTLYQTSNKNMKEGGELLRRRGQPQQTFLGGDRNKPISFSFNGNLTNWQEIARELYWKGYKKQIMNDTHAIAALIETARRETFADALQYEILPRLQWSFCIVFYSVYERRLYAARDPYGFMPLVVGARKKDWLIVASEDCLFGKGGLDCEVLGEVEPGTIVILDTEEEETVQTIRWTARKKPSHCIFQFIYFMRPDSCYCGINVHMTRKRAGELLAEEHPLYETDIIAPVSDSGNAAALGYAKIITTHTGQWLYDSFALFRSHFVGRVFMEPHEHLRAKGIGKKHRAIRECIEGKRITLVDDSIVRGRTAKYNVTLLRDHGAKEVHMRIASPPITWPCHYGIDTPTFEELAFNKYGKSKEGICRYIGADSLEYLSMGGAKRSVLETDPRFASQTPLDKESFCIQCFTGENPIKNK